MEINMNALEITNLQNQCYVCLENKNIECLCITDCNHYFCKECLDKWFNVGKSSCPVCRKNIIYFNYLNETNRVICVTKNIYTPPRLNYDVLYINHRLYKLLLAGSFLGILSSAINIYMFSMCDEFKY